MVWLCSEIISFPLLSVMSFLRTGIGELLTTEHVVGPYKASDFDPPSGSDGCYHISSHNEVAALYDEVSYPQEGGWVIGQHEQCPAFTDYDGPT